MDLLFNRGGRRPLQRRRGGLSSTAARTRWTAAHRSGATIAYAATAGPCGTKPQNSI